MMIGEPGRGGVVSYSSNNYIMVTFLSFNGISHFYNLRPVINIKTDGMTLIGDGTMENPYTLQVAEQVEEPEGSGSVENNNQENSFKNPETRSMIAIGVTIGLIIVLGTGAFVIYRKKMKKIKKVGILKIGKEKVGEY